MGLFTSKNLAKERLVLTMSNPFVELLLSKLTTLLESKCTSPNGSKTKFNKLPQLLANHSTPKKLAEPLQFRACHQETMSLNTKRASRLKDLQFMDSTQKNLLGSPGATKFKIPIL